MEIRWQQRFSSFQKAFGQLERFLTKTELNEMEEQGLIKAFEYTFELAWKTLQDLLKEKGYVDILGPKPVIEQSFQDGYISEGKNWIRMHKSRNLSSRTYNEDVAKELIIDIKNVYFNLLKDLEIRIELERTGTKNPFFDA